MCMCVRLETIVTAKSAFLLFFVTIWAFKTGMQRQNMTRQTKTTILKTISSNYVNVANNCNYPFHNDHLLFVPRRMFCKFFHKIVFAKFYCLVCFEFLSGVTSHTNNATLSRSFLKANCGFKFNSGSFVS